jgi:uncharacterized protein
MAGNLKGNDMRHCILTCILAVGICVPVAAADDPSETHKKAATELLELINLEESMMGGAAAMTDVMVQQNPTLRPYRDVLLKWTEKYMTWEAFGPKVIELYTESFTEPELRDLIAFYKTPTGQKALALMPELARRGAMLGAEVANEHQEDLQQMISERAAQLEKLSNKP